MKFYEVVYNELLDWGLRSHAVTMEVITITHQIIGDLADVEAEHGFVIDARGINAQISGEFQGYKYLRPSFRLALLPYILDGLYEARMSR